MRDLLNNISKVILLSALTLLIWGCSKNITQDPVKIIPPSPVTEIKVTFTIGQEEPLYKLSWKDESLNEKGFKILGRSREDAVYTELGLTKANETEFIDSKSAVDKTFYYRINAFNNDGESTSRLEALRLGFLSSIEKENVIDFELYGAVLLVLWKNGLSTYNVANGKRPKILNTVPLKGFVKNGFLSLNNTLVYIVDDDRFFIFSVRMPYDPTFLSTINLKTDVVGMDNYHESVYILDNQSRLLVINAKNYKKPYRAKIINIPGNPRNLIVRGQKLFIANEKEGIRIYSIEDPLNPQLIKNFNLTTPRYYNALNVSGNKIYASVRDYENELHIIDFADISDMKVTGSLALNWIPMQVALSENIIMIPEAEGGLEILWARDPQNIKIIGSVEPQIDKVKVWPTMTVMSHQDKVYLFSVP